MGRGHGWGLTVVAVAAAGLALPPSALPCTPSQQIAGMSAHYVPIEVPESTQSVEVTLQARGGARFLNRMILGGPTGTDVPWQPQTDRTQLVFRVQLADSAPRQLLLIVTNARDRPSRYAVSWRVP